MTHVHVAAAQRRNAPVRVLAIDPGPTQSAWLLLGADWPSRFKIETNDDVLSMIRASHSHWPQFADIPGVIVIEQIESFGMAVGREVFETVRWAGRFEEAASPLPVVLLPRRTVKLHLCGSSKAKDANIRQALLDRFGGQSAAMGRKAAPGPLYGVSRDVWSALALAVTYSDGAS